MDNITIGSEVKRKNIPHGGMELDTTSIVVHINGDIASLEIDYMFDFTHKLSELELVNTQTVECQSCHKEGIKTNPYELCKSCLEDLHNSYGLNN